MSGNLTKVMLQMNRHWQTKRTSLSLDEVNWERFKILCKLKNIRDYSDLVNAMVEDVVTEHKDEIDAYIEQRKPRKVSGGAA